MKWKAAPQPSPAKKKPPSYTLLSLLWYIPVPAAMLASFLFHAFLLPKYSSMLLEYLNLWGMLATLFTGGATLAIMHSVRAFYLGQRTSQFLYKESEERFRALVEGSLEGIVIQRDFIPLFVNQAFARIHGYKSPEEILQLGSLTPLIAPQDRERLREDMRAVMEGRDEESHFEFQAIRRDGQRIWRENIVRRVVWGGQPALQVTTNDISKRKQAEAATQESRERFYNLIDGSLQGMVIHTHRKLLFVNQAMVNIFGFKSAFDMLTMEDFTQLIHPDDKSRFIELCSSLMESESAPIRYEIRGGRNDETPITVEMLSRVVNWEGARAIQSTVFDITQRKQMEVARAESQAYLSSILDTAADGIVTIDQEGHVETFNKAAETIFGYTADEIIGRNIKLLMPPPDRDNHDHYLKRYRQTGKRAIIGASREVTALRKDGSTFPLLLSVSEVVLGGRRSYTGILRDITTIKQTQSQLIEASRAKSHFLSNMSHELRTPLNGIQGFTQLLLRDSTLSEEQRNYLRIINQSGQHLLELINDVLDIGKIEAGQLELKKEALDLHNLLRHLEDQFALRFSEKDLSLLIRILPGVPEHVFGDKGKLRQVLINLVGNALKFTQKGGVTLTVKPEGKDLLHFSVKDTGPGIPQEDQEKIFQPFIQSSAITAKEGGAGLGLAITKSLVEKMEGRLSLASGPKGSEFTFTLSLPPLAGVDNIAPTQTYDQVVGLEGGDEWRVLVADDDPRNRQLLVQILKNAGFVTQEAHNGQEALDALEPFRPHIVLMDISMPVLDGLAALKKLRTRKNFRSLPVVAVTAGAFVQDQEKLQAAGFDGIVIKPFSPAAILEVIESRLPIQYRFETNREAGPASSLNMADLTGLLSPEETRNLADAHAIGDLEAISRQARQLAKKEPAAVQALGRRLQELVDRYQEEALGQLIRSLELEYASPKAVAGKPR